MVSDVRSTRARYRISPKEQLDVVVRAASAEVADAIHGMADFICSFARVGSLAVTADALDEKPAGSIALACPDFDAYVIVGDLVDFAAERARIEKEIVKAEKELAGAEKTLANEGFVAKAAPEVVEKKRAQAAELAATIEQLKAQIEDFA